MTDLYLRGNRYISARGFCTVPELRVSSSTVVSPEDDISAAQNCGTLILKGVQHRCWYTETTAGRAQTGDTNTALGPGAKRFVLLNPLCHYQFTNHAIL